MKLSRLLPAIVVWFAVAPLRAAEPPLDWRAATAAVVITPSEPMGMAGYAARNKPAEGKAQDLFAKALAVEDAGGHRVLMVTLDLIGVPRPLRDRMEAAVKQKYGLGPEGLLLNASHTHCGPSFSVAKLDADIGGEDKPNQGAAYGKFLESSLLKLADEAFAKLEPARIEYRHARCGFAMNRRLPVDTGFRNSPNPNGPVDQDVPVLAIYGAKNTLRSVLFGYACHNTTMGFYQWCGDYAGYAKEYFEADHPGTTAVFMMGCGGDQNPYPRGRLELAQLHGRALASAVQAALEGPAVSLPSELRAAYDLADLDFAVQSRETYEVEAASKDKYAASHGKRMLQILDSGKPLEAHYTYPVQVLRFGRALTFIALAGETVVDYSLRFKKELAGENVWVAGYSNDVMGYVPSLRVRKEGGYEGGDAMRYGSHPGPWAENVEDRIAEKVHALLLRTEAK